ncbi:hypothetical protein HUJ04_005520 [Dendroctonus ponderosae]|nr:hypothetical protein HUJ04_005520 [Dendroctonus ponderosae]
MWPSLLRVRLSAHIVKVPAVEALKIRRDASLTVAVADERFRPKTAENLIETREVSENGTAQLPPAGRRMVSIKFSFNYSGKTSAALADSREFPPRKS